MAVAEQAAPATPHGHDDDEDIQRIVVALPVHPAALRRVGHPALAAKTRHRPGAHGHETSVQPPRRALQPASVRPGQEMHGRQTENPPRVRPGSGAAMSGRATGSPRCTPAVSLGKRSSFMVDPRSASYGLEEVSDADASKPAAASPVPTGKRGPHWYSGTSTRGTATAAAKRCYALCPSRTSASLRRPRMHRPRRQ